MICDACDSCCCECHWVLWWKLCAIPGVTCRLGCQVMWRWLVLCCGQGHAGCFVQFAKLRLPFVLFPSPRFLPQGWTRAGLLSLFTKNRVLLLAGKEWDAWPGCLHESKRRGGCVLNVILWGTCPLWAVGLLLLLVGERPEAKAGFQLGMYLGHGYLGKMCSFQFPARGKLRCR